MSAQADLLRLYQDWRNWTDAEREAILANDWRHVKACQAAKATLQGEILKHTDEARNECAVEGSRAAFDKQIRSVINELIYLETRNGEFIAEQRAAARADYEAMERCSRNVTRVHTRYAPAGAGSWESYS